MSVRKRAIQNRLARELQEEQAAHEQTRRYLEARDKLIKELEGKLNALERKDQVTTGRLNEVLKLIAEHFTDPPRPLSRKSELFELVQRLAPREVPALPPSPSEVLSTFLGMVDRDSIRAVQAVITPEQLHAPYDAFENIRQRAQARADRVNQMMRDSRESRASTEDSAPAGKPRYEGGTCSCGKYPMGPGDEHIEDDTGYHDRAADSCHSWQGAVL